MVSAIKTVAKEANATVIEKKSRFIAYVKSINSEDEAMEFVNQIKLLHRDARHNCFAYQVGNREKFSDDGEPQGTAGKPILEILKKEGLANTVIVVTRYFGGILLGAGGLVRAYSSAAKAGVLEAGWVIKYPATRYCLQFSYNMLASVNNHLEKIGAIIDDTEYLDNITLYCYIKSDEANEIVCGIKSVFYEGLSISSLGEEKWFSK